MRRHRRRAEGAAAVTARWLTMQEAAAQLGCVSVWTLRRLHREGRFPARMVGRRLVISERLLDQWAESFVRGEP